MKEETTEEIRAQINEIIETLKACRNVFNAQKQASIEFGDFDVDKAVDEAKLKHKRATEAQETDVYAGYKKPGL